MTSNSKPANPSRRSFLATAAAAGLSGFALTQYTNARAAIVQHRFFDASALRQRHDSRRHPLAPHRQRERHDRAYSGGGLRNAGPAGSPAPARLPGARL